MIRVQLAILFVFASSCLAIAQNYPWNAKIMVEQIGSGEADTVWIGMDSLGDIGYHAGLDSFDTVFVKPVSILAHDPVVEQQFGAECGNLSRDIRAFKTGHIDFTFYVHSDSFGFPPDTFRLYWDTLDFLNSNDSFEIWLVRIRTEGGYVFAADQTEAAIFSINPPLHFPRPIETPLLWEQTPWECNYPIEFMKVYLELYINTFGVGIQELAEASVRTFPNPSNGKIIVEFEKAFNGHIEIRDLQGRLIGSIQVSNESRTEANLNDPGIFFCLIRDKDSNLISIKKIIIIK